MKGIYCVRNNEPPDMPNSDTLQQDVTIIASFLQLVRSGILKIPGITVDQLKDESEQLIEITKLQRSIFLCSKKKISYKGTKIGNSENANFNLDSKKIC